MEISVGATAGAGLRDKRPHEGLQA